jgi:hypothetical protein
MGKRVSAEITMLDEGGYIATVHTGLFRKREFVAETLDGIVKKVEAQIRRELAGA